MRRIFLLLPLMAMLGACIDSPQVSKSRGTKQSATVITPRPEARQCLAQLGQTNASFTPLPDQYFGGGCSNLNTVKLSDIRGDYNQLAVANLGPLACPVASTFAQWARFGADRAARQILGSGLVRIETMGSYACRNVAGTGRRSAHATANAVDVSAFILENGQRISVLEHWNNGSPAERQFLRVVQDSACKRFGTVLGPNYNQAHRDHLHLEIGNGAFCR
ncbi:extensin family protein [Caenibius tardaugens]|uniref:extensin family protein n=1 Tax=Caenibius tardaugens TaxID=169176 RepID=UPI0005939509|nr:extensin family protein [Caenibius tardaugens]AZI37063.1 extensin family protein [Caenibius tardaugens NBRC 16725]